MDGHTYAFEQYCAIVSRNIVLQEIMDKNGQRKLCCLNLPVCKEKLGGCKNKFVLARIEAAASGCRD